MSTETETKKTENPVPTPAVAAAPAPAPKRSFGGAPQQQQQRNKPSSEGDLLERTIFINRVTKVVKGGRTFSFSAFVVVGDQRGKVGIGKGKAKEVPEAIRKAIEEARRNVVKIQLAGVTIPHQILGEYGAGKVFLKPASEGTGVIAGGAVRIILETLGVKDILTKSIGSNNPYNMSKALMSGLTELRSKESIAKKRGIPKERLQ